MKCTIKTSREIVGGRMVEWILPDGQTVSEFKINSLRSIPNLAALQSVHIAVNNDYAETAVL